MIEFIQEVIFAMFISIGITVWLGILAYAISKGWHKAKSEFPTTINRYNHPLK